MVKTYEGRSPQTRSGVDVHGCASAMGLRALIIYFLGRHGRSSLASSCVSQKASQLSVGPSRAAW